MPFLCLIAFYNSMAFGGPMRTPLESTGHFSWSYVAEHLPFYAETLMLCYPLMLVAPVFYQGRLRWEIRWVCSVWLLFYSSYYFITQGRNAIETLVAGQRFLLPAIPLFLFAYIGWLDGLVRRARIQVDQVVLPVAAVLLVFAFGLSRAHAAYLQRQVDLRETLLRETPPEAVLLCNKDVAKLFQPVWGYREYLLITDAAGHYRPPKLERYRGRPVYIAMLLRSDRPAEKDGAAEAVRRVLALPGVQAEPIATPFPDLEFHRVQLLPDR